ncbi:MAG: cupin domain-containing protein [Gammaproteobacteria bacterium]|nr:cupin domain-containing protein [Gammaproteobacteria bacterium]
MRSVLLGLLLAAIAGPVPAADWISAPHGAPETRAIAQLLKDQPLAAGANIRVIRLQKTDHSAQFLVQIRGREPLHYHADSDITVFLLRGRGRIRIGERERPARAGDVIHIARGAAHAYINEGPEIGVAFVVYSPPPGPDDRVLVEPSGK